MKKVLIIQEGQWGQLQACEYEKFVDSLVMILSHSGTVVEVVPTAESAALKINRECVDIVIFVSRDMARTAEDFAKRFPRARIMVFTGLIPEGKVVYISKYWIRDQESLMRFVLLD